jgi:type I restriction enzyme S subunit
MKVGWESRKLGDVCEIERGGSPRPIDRFITDAPDGINWIKIGDTKNVTKYIYRTEQKIKPEGAKCSRMVFEGDFILSNSMSFGRPYIMKTTGCIHDGWLVLRKPNVDQNYLYYVLGSDLVFNQFDRLAAGSTVRNLNIGLVKSVEIPIPPLPEQQRIVGILDEAFDGIATAKANAEKNLQNARALFDAHLQSVFSQHGEGWKMEQLETLTDLSRGHNPPKSKFSQEAKPGYVRFYQIRDGGSDAYTVYVPDTPQLHKMNKDDIMMVAYRHVGRVFRGVEGAFNVALCKITNTRRDLLDDDYLFHILPSRYVKGELLKRSERSLIPSMSIEHLKEIKIPLPPISEQHLIVDSIKSLMVETQRLESIYQQKLSALDALKKSLLDQAFTGVL